MLDSSFFKRDTCLVAKSLLHKVIRRYIHGHWLSVQIIETEAYTLEDKASHASLGYSEKRKALFMPAGTIYMYYARGRASLNISCKGAGNAVLIKSGYPYQDTFNNPAAIALMQQNNPRVNSHHPRPVDKLCNGQTLLCAALGLTVPDWDQKTFTRNEFYIEDVGVRPTKVIQTTRLGIPTGRDEQRLYRFVDAAMARYCTSNPLTKRDAIVQVL